jgi:pyruvate dehydrogenase E1 component alpha subunit
MHLFDPAVNFACSGIIAQGCPPAVGAAMAAKKRNTDHVAVAFLGEGAIDQGGFFESLNLAKIQNLPVIFVVEDNDWAISMPKERVTDVQDGTKRADGHDMPGIRVDHDDAIDVYEAAEEAVGRARDGNGPTLIEVQVHRRMGHFMGDAEGYRPDDDIERHQARDSIERLAAVLETHGLTQDDFDEIRARSERRVEEAIDWAKEQPLPQPEEAYENVFTNPPAGVTESPPAASAPGGDE